MTYTLSSVTDRVQRIRRRYRETTPKACVARFRIVTEFYKTCPPYPAIIKRGMLFKELCEKMPVLVNEDELVVGELATTYRGSALFPEYSVGWLFDELHKGRLSDRTLDPYEMDEIDGKLYGTTAKDWQFYKSITLVCDGVITLSKRYAAECRRQAEACADAERKAELEGMAANLDWIMEHPCITFEQAVQCIFLYQIALALDGNLHGLTIGRADQYLGALYEEGTSSGRLTPERAQEWIDAFCLKVSEMNKVSSARVTFAIGGYTSGQLLTLGGVKPETGEDATNPVTYMFLQSAGRLVLHDPPMSLRIHKNTPAELWEAGLATSRKCGGVPTFENDEVIIPALQARGMSLESARNYCLIGCVEPGGCGDEWPACGGPGQEPFWLLPNTLLLAMNNGASMKPSPDGSEAKPTGPQTGFLYDMKSFDELKDAVAKQIKCFVDWQIAFTNMHEYVAGENMPLPIVSATMDGCMESAKDVMWGGAKYNSTGTAAVGLGTMVDSLAAIKYFVFDEKLCTARELYDAVKGNWEGAEQLCARIRAEAPHFGNDVSYVDELARWVSDVYAECVEAGTGPRGNRFAPGMYPVATHVLYGRISWATPDGRHSGDPFSDGISPVQCMDVSGPVGIMESCSKVDHRRFSNGTLLNMKFHPRSLEGPGAQKLQQLMATYFDMGGMELQLNIVSADELRDAQVNPDAHKDLVVRIAGFSAYFVELWKNMQDDVINRTEVGIA